MSGTVLLTVIGKISDFADENKLAAYLGLVPRITNSNESERSGAVIDPRRSGMTWDAVGYPGRGVPKIADIERIAGIGK